MSASESTDEQETESSKELDEQAELESEEGEEEVEGEEVEETEEEETDDTAATTERMLHSDYTQKTQALAKELKDSRISTEATLNRYKSLFEKQLAALDKVDVDDLTQSGFRTLEKDRRELEKAIEGTEADAVTSTQLTPDEVQKETEALALLMPHWHTDQGVDQSKMQNDIQLIVKTAKEIGFDLVPDSKLYRIFYEAAQFRQLDKGKLSTGKTNLKKSTSTKPAKKKTSSGKKSREELYYGT